MIYLIALVTEILLICADQWTKALALSQLKPTGGIPLIEGVFSLSYVENSGAAFGMLSGARPFFWILTPIVIVVIGYYFYKMPRTTVYHWVRAALLLIAAGAAGNFIDRFLNGFVIDFLYFSLIDFPVFNVADIYVVAGSFLLGVLVLFFVKEPSKE
ncbi:MAG: signal peptidase II [Clostridiales bacterium]|jgi:signal peptidase II|nr:signal peptidase II [Clostridiales bacterium]